MLRFVESHVNYLECRVYSNVVMKEINSKKNMIEKLKQSLCFRAHGCRVRLQSLYFRWTKWRYGECVLCNFSAAVLHFELPFIHLKVTPIFNFKFRQVCDILFCFNTKTQQWERPEVSGNLPGARDGHSACIVEHKMYIFGGFEEMMDQFSRDVHCLDLKTMQWSFVYT